MVRMERGKGRCVSSKGGKESERKRTLGKRERAVVLRAESMISMGSYLQEEVCRKTGGRLLRVCRIKSAEVREGLAKIRLLLSVLLFSLQQTDDASPFTFHLHQGIGGISWPRDQISRRSTVCKNQLLASFEFAAADTLLHRFSIIVTAYISSQL